MRGVGSEEPANKKLKVSPATTLVFGACQTLLSNGLVPPSTLIQYKANLSLEKVKQLFDDHSFRTSVVMSPRPALSIYVDSCVLLDGRNETSLNSDPFTSGKSYLITMLGLHPDQNQLEKWYSTIIKKLYSLKLFLAKVNQVCAKAIENDKVGKLISDYTLFLGTCLTLEECQAGAATVSEKVATLITACVEVDHRIRPEQLEKEYERMVLWNSTYTNALVQLLMADHHTSVIKDIFFKRSHLPKYERITIYLYDPDIDELKPPRFTFMPSLKLALEGGPEKLVEDMMGSFWESLLRHGYFCTSKIKSELSPDIRKYFLSGIAHDLTIPLKLNAHFGPTYPLSFYLYGKAGAGKSSLVRNFSPAINAAIEQHADPELLVRFVKQNLNKPMQDLELELELRPNNNDLSVMSIIQGRRMTMSQSKPGLVVVDLEEMASNAVEANPNQLRVSQLLSQRFSGRNGDYKDGSKVPRNSAKRGISGDATLVVLFTSNYTLEEECQTALSRLSMFQNLTKIEMTAVSGADRKDFAYSYVQQMCQDRFSEVNGGHAIELDLQIPFGTGDTRPLVRHLRMLAFYICAQIDSVTRNYNKSVVKAKVVQDETSCAVSVERAGSVTSCIKLKVGSLENLLPETFDKAFDVRTEGAMNLLAETGVLKLNGGVWLAELSQIVDYYFAKTLCPAVVVSKNKELIHELVKAVGSQNDVHSILNVDPASYKMMKSLYDPNDTPNLRDDILKYGKGSFVCVELCCASSTDSQLCIREMIEDSPSMTAFSTNKSALYKAGLFFGVYVAGEITPEVYSRASLILG